MAADICQIPRQPDGQSYYNDPTPSASLRRSPPSSSSLFLDTTSPPPSSSPRSGSFTPPCDPAESNNDPAFSHTPASSPQISTGHFSSFSAYSSSPFSSGLTIDTSLDDDDIDFPNYDTAQLPLDRKSDVPNLCDEPEISTATDTTRSDSPLPTPTVVDDTAVKQLPSRHVDYLSHDWREEDIWSSWRHIVSQRNVYGQKSRLENASWRTWAKSKYRLRTLPPEKLNWLKESDVTWLYGPLKPASTHPVTSDTSEPSSQLSKSSSFVNKKPILKKRSASEVMLQRSLSSSSLLKQAAASVQAQQGLRHSRTNSGIMQPSSIAPSQPPSRDHTDYFSSRTGSFDGSSTSPAEVQPERHIRFDEKVEQCIAVEMKDGDISEDDSEPENDPPNSTLSDSSDEGLLMMKRNRHKPCKPCKTNKTEKNRDLSRSNSFQGRMIEEIEATTLKYRTDSPDVTQQNQHHVFGGVDWNSKRGRNLSPSASQETLRPTRPSRNFLLADDDEDDGVGATDSSDPGSSSWSFGASNPKSSLGAASSPSAGATTQGYFDDGNDGIEGMRRTESGMFMPYDNDEDDMVSVGLFGRVSETINTMRDIGHVLYTAFRS